MSATTFRRKDLKHDEFVTTAGQMTRWLMERRRRIGWGLIIVVVMLSLVAMLQVYNQRQEARAAALLAVALEVYRAPVVDDTVAQAGPEAAPEEEAGEAEQESETASDPAAASAEGAEAGADAAAGEQESAAEARVSTAATADEHAAAAHLHFRTETAKYEAAAAELIPIVEDYGNTASGKIAAFYLGLCESALGNSEAAVEAFEAASGSSRDLTAAMALYRLGHLRLEAGNTDEAIADFDLLLRRYSEVFPAEEALMSKARAQEAVGDARAALVTYQLIVDDYGTSALAAQARTRVEELSAQLGLDPDVERG